MPATGPRMVTWAEYDKKVRSLEKQIADLRRVQASTGNGLPAATYDYVEDFDVDGTGHVSNVTKKSLVVRDGLVIDSG